MEHNNDTEIIALKRLKEKLPEEEFINYLVKLMIDKNLRPYALKGFDAVKMVNENRDD
jgi:hypothetical protein